MDKLPIFTISEILGFLDTRNNCRLRLVNKVFYQAARPIVFQIHSLKNVKREKYRDFLKKKGRFIKELVFSNERNLLVFLEHGLILSEIFPELKAVTFDYPCSSVSLRILAVQTSKLCELQALRFNNFYTVRIGNQTKTVKRYLKTLFTDLTLFPEFKSIPFKIEFVTKRRNQPLICSAPNPLSLNGRAEGVFYSSDSLLLQLPRDRQHIQPPEGFSYRFESRVEMPNYYEIRGRDLYSKLFQLIPGHIEHLSILDMNFIESITGYCSISNIPSLSLGCVGCGIQYHSIYANFGLDAPRCHTVSKIHFSRKPQATKLDLQVADRCLPAFFKWASAYFTNLQHLYIKGLFNNPDILLDRNMFPTLIHFYSKVDQHDSFWPEFFKAAPKLLYVHTDSIRANVLGFESMKPLLQLVPYQDIFGTCREDLRRKGITNIDNCL